LFRKLWIQRSRGGLPVRLYSTLSAPRPVFDSDPSTMLRVMVRDSNHEAQTRRELGAEGRTEGSSRRSPQQEPMGLCLSAPNYPARRRN
ncbi:MAG: hypothetical protein O7C72_12015, partial [Deltaproteobacteria bacterium]|nr:hypothetical protein [Deltaproteobacteria bacterium]